MMVVNCAHSRGRRVEESEPLIEFWISIKVVQRLASNAGRSTEMLLAQFLMHEYAGQLICSRRWVL